MTSSPEEANTQGISPPEENQETSLRAKIENKNLAEGMDEKLLEEISQQVADGFEYDLQSRDHWERCLEEWTKLALQVREEKSFPWPKASNIKYPLLSIASMQFNARAYPSLVPATSNIVKVEVIGNDPDGQKLEKAKRISDYMSYQVLNQMDGWEEDMDKLLIMLPIIGTVFKKTYYNPVLKQNCSELVLPKNLVVNYWAKNLESAERISEVVYLNKRNVKEKQMSGIYLKDVELGDPNITSILPNTQKEQNVATKIDEAIPYTIVEQHTYWDMDDDGYTEPYIVTFDRATKKVLRITARFDEESIKISDDGELQKIIPLQYYTKYSFIPNPDGGFYDIGFGLLLGPINESVNTLVNQLVDAGTISNLQAGFLGKGLKLKMGSAGFQPGEWKSVNSTADDLRKQIVPLPVKDPSPVLFQLMTSLVSSGKELASVAEIFTGKMPGQNTPATTTMATVEQGMKVFTAVYKRVFRAMKSEFKKIFELNATYLDPQQYQAVVDAQIGPDDFDNSSYDVCPGADPNTATQSEKLMKAQGLQELIPLGTLDVVEVTRRMLDAMEQPSPDKLLNQQIQQTGAMQPPPDPKMLELQMKGQMDQQKAAIQAQAQEHKSALAERDQAFQHMMQQHTAAFDAQNQAMQAQVSAAAQLHMDNARIQGEAMKQAQNVVHTEQTHQQKLIHSGEQSSAKIQQMKAQSQVKPSGAGSKKR